MNLQAVYLPVMTREEVTYVGGAFSTREKAIENAVMNHAMDDKEAQAMREALSNDHAFETFGEKTVCIYTREIL